MKHYRIKMDSLVVEAEDQEDAEQQARSMIEEGAWELTVTEESDGDILQVVEVSLEEMLNCHMGWEDFTDLLKDKVEEKIGRELAFWQMVLYTIVDSKDDSVLIQVEGYEEIDFPRS